MGGIESTRRAVDGHEDRTEHDLFDFEEESFSDEEHSDDDVDKLQVPLHFTDHASNRPSMGRSSMQGSLRKVIGSINKGARKVMKGVVTLEDSSSSRKRTNGRTLDLVQGQRPLQPHEPSDEEASRRTSRISSMRQSLVRKRSASSSRIPDPSFDGGQVQTLVYAWGRRDLGQLLGAGSPKDDAKRYPSQAQTLVDLGVVAVSGSLFHSVAVCYDGTVIGSGDNAEGQLQSDQTSDNFMSSPKFLTQEILKTKTIVAAAVGLYHTALLSSEGEVLTMGHNEFGQLGRGEAATSQLPLRAILPQHHAVQVACSESATFVLTAQGKLFACGEGGQGVLGTGDLESRQEPTQVKGLLEGVPICHVAAGAHHVMAVSASGRVYSWGRNRHGQLGVPNGSAKVEPSPVSVDYFNLSRPPRRMTRKDLNRKSISRQTNASGLVAPAQVRIRHVSCGDNHSAFVTTRGVLFTCGKGDAGQLGLVPTSVLDIRHVATPEPVVDLPARVARVACGANHTVVLLRDSQLFAFGDDRDHILGVRRRSRSRSRSQQPDPEGSPETSSVKAPCKVARLENVHVLSVSAGGQSTFIVADPAVHTSPSPAQQVIKARALSHRPVARVNPAVIERLVRGHDGRPDTAPLRSVLNASLFDPATLNASFLVLPVDQRLAAKRVGPKPRAGISGVDVSQALHAFEAVSRAVLDGIVDAQFIVKQLGALMDSLYMMAARVRSADQLRVYMLVFLVPTVWNTRYPLFKQAVMTVNYLSAEARSTLFRWIERDIPSALFRPGLLQPALALVEPLVESRRWSNPLAKAVCQFLTQLYWLNERVGERKGSPIVSYSAFYSTKAKALRDEDLANEYVLWRDLYYHSPGTALTRSDVETGKLRFSILDYPFLFTPESKRLLMRFEDTFKMHSGAVENLLFAGNVFFFIRVRREHLLQDTLNTLMGTRESTLRAPLRIKFEGEEGLDAGGVKKEFFLLLSDQLFNPDYGMFTVNEETQQIWFNPTSALISDPGVPVQYQFLEFRMVGMLIGLAIYNDTLINVNFPKLIYHWMLGKKSQISLQTLATIDPILARGLRQMLEYKGDDFEDVFAQSFEVSHQVFGETITKPLKAGGEHIPVTRENVKEYVNLYVRYVLSDSVNAMANAMIEGFHKVVPTKSPPVHTFRPEELELLATGTRELDFVALANATTYEGGFSTSSTTVKHFWNVLLSMNEEEKGRFLQFTTGSKRAPVGGLSSSHFQFKVQRAGPDSDHLPTAHTCFNTIMLPDYKNEAKLRTKLSIAIDNSLGFGLE